MQSAKKIMIGTWKITKTSVSATAQGLVVLAVLLARVDVGLAQEPLEIGAARVGPVGEEDRLPLSH